jgi:PilZ domain-containing protein
MEHRRGERIAVDVPVGVTNPVTAHSRVGRLINLSVDGALISGSFDSHIGARVHVSIDVPPHARATGSLIAAYIVRKAAGAFAVQWAEYGSTDILAFFREHSLQESAEPPVKPK